MRSGANAAPQNTSMRKWGNGESAPPPSNGPTYHTQSWRQPATAPTPDNVPPPAVPDSIRASIAANVKSEPGGGASARSAKDGAQDGPRKRKSRWGDDNAKVQMPGLPTAIAGAVSGRDLENYSRSLRLEEITRKLRMNDFIPPEGQRSPSPPPAYDSHGRRTNKRDLRYKKKLEDEKHILIEAAMANDPSFRCVGSIRDCADAPSPPQEYMSRLRGGRAQDKVFIPVKEFPEINFFGLLVGPRGNSLKKMERESGAKISIRGKGSVKEGKQRPDGFQDDENEELHCLVMGDTEQQVRKCIQLIQNVIETAASTPESANDHKRNQLRELALLNGTLRDDEGQACQNCGQIGHRKCVRIAHDRPDTRRYDCPEQRNFTANIICRTCGQAGHMARCVVTSAESS